MTRYGSADFEGFFWHELQALGEDCMKAVPNGLLAVVLGGGYGRGEGAVVTLNGRQEPYNDLDLFLVFDGRRKGLPPELEPIRHKWENRLGIEVDFSRPLWPAAIKRWPAALMWHDLALGHRIMAGEPAAISGYVPPCVLDHPRPIEALRLLLNRGAGLLWTMEVVAGNTEKPDADFIRRNVQKAFLSAGDAILLVHGMHHHLVAERGKLFQQLHEKNPKVAALDLNDNYQRAVEFKSSPDSVPAEVNADDLDAARHAWLASLLYSECVRTGNNYSSINELVADPSIREPEKNQWWQRPANLLRGMRNGQWSTLYPREALYRTLPLMLMQQPTPQQPEKLLDVWRGVA